jgi:hypothetical protein
VGRIEYNICVGWKPIPGTDPVEYYPWLGEALYFGVDVTNPTPYDPVDNPSGELMLIGPNQTAPGGYWCIWQSPDDWPLSKFADPHINWDDTITIGLDVPVFETYWNEHTDVATKPSGLSGPSYEIKKKLPDGSDNPAWKPDGVTLGLDIIIQVRNIY